MNTPNKRKDSSIGDSAAKRVKKECSYGEKCYRKNPAHFREFSHPHLESILDLKKASEDYEIPQSLYLQRHLIIEQLEIIVEKQIYIPNNKSETVASTSDYDILKKDKDIVSKDSNKETNNSKENNHSKNLDSNNERVREESDKLCLRKDLSSNKQEKNAECANQSRVKELNSDAHSSLSTVDKAPSSSTKDQDPNYRPIIPPTRRIEDFMKVVAPRGKMAAKHAASAPYHIFYTTITDEPRTHRQPYSITFQEILDPSFGELKCSLQLNFMVEIGWLLAQYYFAGYSGKKLTILYGDDSPDLKDIGRKKPNVDAHLVNMATPFGKHHTKMMILCYEDGSLRVVVSTANLYIDDWENRTQGLWISPRCPELPADAMPFAGDSPTQFKKSLLRYLNHYHLPSLAYYVERVKRCDFTAINVFLVASVQGSHFDAEWGLTRVAALLRAHSESERTWPLIAQASSLGSYGKHHKLWLTGDFLYSFIKTKNQPQTLMQPPDFKLIYPSLGFDIAILPLDGATRLSLQENDTFEPFTSQNVRQSHDNLLGGGCLPYSAELHSKQTWIRDFMFQWKAVHTFRDRAMPHIKSYLRMDPSGKSAAFYLLTSANVSKAAWGQINKGNGALRLMSYEAGVLFLPQFVINKSLFPLSEGESDRLVIPYDLPPVRYADTMSPWVQDYLH